MILVDTSVWVDHLRSEVPHLTDLLHNDQVAMHPMVAGELACGNLRDRAQVLETLFDLPAMMTAFADEVLVFIEQRRLMGRGIGYVDMNLLASVALDESSRLWAVDRRLHSVAVDLELAYDPPGLG